MFYVRNQIHGHLCIVDSNEHFLLIYCFHLFITFAAPLLLNSVIDAVKMDGVTKSQDHLGLLITKRLNELDLKSFRGLSEEAAFLLLFTAASLPSVCNCNSKLANNVSLF